jgi:hypothetical protein
MPNAVRTHSHISRTRRRVRLPPVLARQTVPEVAKPHPGTDLSMTARELGKLQAGTGIEPTGPDRPSLWLTTRAA